MINFVTTTQANPAIAQFYDRVLLKRGENYRVHDRFAQKRPIKKRMGNQILFRGYGSLPPLPVALVEGTPPPGQIPTHFEIYADLKEYGGWIPHSELVDLVNQDATLTEYNEMLGEQGGESVDIVFRDVYSAGTNVYYAGSYASAAIDTRVEVNTAPTAKDFKKIREGLIGNKARMISMQIKASSGQGTMPVPPSFYCIAHHELQNDLEDMSGWLPRHQYPNPAAAQPEEIGALPDANMRFLITQNGKLWTDAGGTTGAGSTYRSLGGSNVDVYSVLVYAQNAVGVCPLDGESMRSIIKAVGSAGSADPLNQQGSVGWKAITTAAILKQLWITRGEFAATL